MVSYVFYMEIHPNAFATELKRMIAAKIGQRYWIIKLKILFLRKVPPSCSTSSSIFFVPTTLDIRRQVAIAAIGIMTEFVRKSKKSRKSNPKIVILLHAPNPKDDGTASNRAMINIVIHAVPRFIWNLSIRTATSVSSSEMEEVSAASNTKIKNTAAITLETVSYTHLTLPTIYSV